MVILILRNGLSVAVQLDWLVSFSLEVLQEPGEAKSQFEMLRKESATRRSKKSRYMEMKRLFLSL
jgi:hypothetical protein